VGLVKWPRIEIWKSLYRACCDSIGRRPGSPKGLQSNKYLPQKDSNHDGHPLPCNSRRRSWSRAFVSTTTSCSTERQHEVLEKRIRRENWPRRQTCTSHHLSCGCPRRKSRSLYRRIRVGAKPRNTPYHANRFSQSRERRRPPTAESR